jgi:hypothetical protein
MRLSTTAGDLRFTIHDLRFGAGVLTQSRKAAKGQSFLTTDGLSAAAPQPK